MGPHGLTMLICLPIGTIRMKVLVYDGFGIWLAARRLNKGHFV
ncbi:Mobile element protein [Caballeronia sordidicola]|uniref:Mobile element protein n=1 Tax=Caballeronia sordidicola TaxID=196367 RepID=A0A226X8H4_CABSO|nr:Mobile element protein [Caballeronia sordidicola]